jgi:hypothetical protein
VRVENGDIVGLEDVEDGARRDLDVRGEARDAEEVAVAALGEALIE